MTKKRKVNTKKRRKSITKKLVEYSQGKNVSKFDGLQKCNQKKIKLQRAYRRMPWYMAPKKDVTSCEKLRGVANRPRSVDIRMRELTISNVMVSLHEYIV